MSPGSPVLIHSPSSLALRFQYMLREGGRVLYLLRKGAPVNAVMYENDPVAQTWFGFMNLGTPLHTAARDGNEDIVRLLVKHGARLSIRDHKEGLAADKAERAGHTGAAQYLRGLQAAQGLSKLSRLTACWTVHATVNGAVSDGSRHWKSRSLRGEKNTETKSGPALPLSITGQTEYMLTVPVYEQQTK